ncbi:MAG TPA: PfkB family carbohydrate kinase [Candidatus Omnitrophota bacterium]|nr:PfkB family carbohydrate kinase [Candidatus Omnitrophota bacterium]HPS19977.1 PfkB family carbohydrate kinase [Candidatus Omnitrophota bacterium]
MRLTVIGTVAFDSVETAHGKRDMALGGSATYASLSASFFSPVNLISVVGTDFPEKYLKMFKSHGVDISGVEMKEGKTFYWKARYDADFAYATTLDTQLNVFADFEPSIPKIVKPSDNLLLANIDPDFQEYIFRNIKPTGLVACDTMNLWINTKKTSLLKLLKKVDILLLNDAEARMLSGEKNLMSAAKCIASHGAKMVVIKKGEHGALYFHNGLKAIVPAYLLESISDPTGAGDTFAGGMMGYLSRKTKVTDTDLRRSLMYGSILASFTVQKFSADGLLNIRKNDVERRYKHFSQLLKN